MIAPGLSVVVGETATSLNGGYLPTRAVAFQAFGGPTRQACQPHEALIDETPASIWTSSPRPYPRGRVRPEYPGHCEIRRVSTAGTFRLFKTQVFLSHALADDDIALEEVDDGLWNILFYSSLIARFDRRTRVITGADFRHSKG